VCIYVCMYVCVGGEKDRLGRERWRVNFGDWGLCAKGWVYPEIRDRCGREMIGGEERFGLSLAFRLVF
jgi:hypothetical protein